MDKQERHRNNLHRALGELPSYQPPDQVWDGIARELGESALHQAIEALPAYRPPEGLWQAIEQDLGRTPPTTAPSRRPRIRPLWISIAATLALALLSLWWVVRQDQESIPQVRITYQTETTASPLALTVSEDGDEAMQTVLAAFEQRPYLQRTVDYHQLRGELNELTEARDELREALQRFGQDADLIRRMGRIERDRSQIIKQLAAAI